MTSCPPSSSLNFFPARCFFLCHIFLIHNVTINSNNLFVNFRWMFTFCVEKSYDGTHLAFGGTLDRYCHFKHISLKQSGFYCCQTSMTHRIKVDGSVAIISIRNFTVSLHMRYLYFLDTPRKMYTFTYMLCTIQHIEQTCLERHTNAMHIILPAFQMFEDIFVTICKQYLNMSTYR